MNRLKAFLAAFVVMLGTAMAQTGTVSVTASHIVDSTGTPLASGVVYFAPVDTSGNPISYHMNGLGQALSRPVSATVTNGAFSLTLPNTSLTTPLNVCFSVSVIDNNTGQNVLGGGYSCLQPSSTSTSWCTGTTCNFDNYVPNLSSIGVTYPAIVSLGTVTSGIPSSSPMVSISGTPSSAILNFTLPQSTQFSLGTVETGTPGSAAAVSISGTAPNAILNFILPQGIQGPVGYTVSCGTTGGCVTPGPFIAQSVDNVEFADSKVGSDEGAKITAAFALMAGTSAVPTQAAEVDLSPNQVYEVSTAFSIPNSDSAPYIKYAILDCKGSVLTWNGSGDFISVLEENAADMSGILRNCFIANASGNTASLNGIHQYSRVGFTYESDYVYGFANAGASGLFIDNPSESGSPSAWPGYNEHTRIIDGIYYGNTKNIRFLGADGGTGSMARTLIRGVTIGTTAAGQYGMTVEGNGTAQSGYMYNSSIELRGNIAANSTALLLETGGTIDSSVVNLGVENTGGTSGYLISIADGISSVYNSSGIADGNGLANSLCAACTSDQINIFSPEGGFVLQEPPNFLGVQQARNSKLMLNQPNSGAVGAWRYGIASYGGAENNAYWQVFQRTTSGADQEVDSTTGASPQNNLAFCMRTGCGFGAGYGFSSATGGTNLPTNPIEVNNGAFKVAANGAVTAPSVTATGNVGGATLTATGNVGGSTVTASTGIAVGPTTNPGMFVISNPSSDNVANAQDGIQFNDASGWGDAAIYSEDTTGYNGILIFATDGDGVSNYNPTEKMRIMPNGYVGIGTAAPTTALQVNGTITGTTKNFQIPYPGDPTKQLVHSTLEGPEIAVFYRGVAQLANGIATVTLPPYFEALTTTAGRTVLLTPQFQSETEPISQVAASSVVDGKFTVRASDTNNLSQMFSWEVKAVRSDQPALRVVIPTPPKRRESTAPSWVTHKTPAHRRFHLFLFSF